MPPILDSREGGDTGDLSSPVSPSPTPVLYRLHGGLANSGWVEQVPKISAASTKCSWPASLENDLFAKQGCGIQSAYGMREIAFAASTKATTHRTKGSLSLPSRCWLHFRLI